MNRILLFFAFALAAGCANSDYAFERLDGDTAVPLPLKFEGFYGLRDGAVVSAEARFADGGDMATMNITIFLRPPAEFRSGASRVTVAGNTTAGAVDCLSLTFLGGQTALPNVGGVFVLKDEHGRPKYRVRIPATMLTRP